MVNRKVSCSLATKSVDDQRVQIIERFQGELTLDCRGNTLSLQTFYV
jgi:hypothetical protein